MALVGDHAGHMKAKNPVNQNILKDTGRVKVKTLAGLGIKDKVIEHIDALLRKMIFILKKLTIFGGMFGRRNVYEIK